MPPRPGEAHDDGFPYFERGVLHARGSPRFLLSADYPYYRDHRDHWRTRLATISEAGIDIVTTYVPWRHHAPADPQRGGVYDFDGRTQPNRDVRGFVRACAEMGLDVILKPGPFVHAELRYGGLPDHVDPRARDDIEPERDGSGEAYCWTAPGGEKARALPAPLDDTFCAHVDDWLSHVAREVIVPFSAPEGPVIAIQLLNEGIYSDSASGLIPHYGYSASSTRAWWRFLERTYGSIDRYNALHASRHAGWEDVQAPAAVAPSRERAGMLTYLDRSRFLHELTMEVLQRYAMPLWAAGVDRRMPILLNFCPNVHAFRRYVASNDGWYSKVAWHPRHGVQWGVTDWIGLAHHDPRAYLQYVLCATRERGPNVEENWGFSGIYDPAYAHVQPSYFQSLLSIAAGATGLNVYTMVGTSAWRQDHNINTVGIPRVAGAKPPLDEDYPGHAPIASDGSRGPKFWTLMQLTHHLAAEGASLVGDRRADVAWAVYPPYAWAGAWAPSGEPDEAPWREAGFRAMPHVTYRGLEAFLETASERALDVAQVNVMDASPEELGAYACLVLAGYEFMDAATQRKLVGFVESGGTLLVTGILPSLDGDLVEMGAPPLRRRIFDHRREEPIARDPERLRAIRLVPDEHPLALVRDPLVSVEPPPDAEARFLDDEGRVVGYVARRGGGTAIYVGGSPWYAAAHGDDPRLVAADRAFLERTLARVGGVRVRYACARVGDAHAHDVDVWQYGAFQPARLGGDETEGITDVEHVLIVHRGAMPATRDVEFTRRGGARTRFAIALAPSTVCIATFEHGRARSLLLKCVNDHDGIRIPPYVSEPGGLWLADAPCDLSVTRRLPSTLEILVAHAERDTVVVDVPIPADTIRDATDGSGRRVRVDATANGARVHVRDARHAGVHTLRLAPRPEALTR